MSMSPSNSARYINREASWLRFNERVLAEAENTKNPVLERIKFLAIFESNLDEFYMVRVSGLIEQETAKLTARTPDGFTASEQLRMIAEAAEPLRQRANAVWQKLLEPALKRIGIKIVKPDELDAKTQKRLAEYFDEEVFPLCTPLMLEPAFSFPFISNRSLNLAVVIKDGDQSKLARVKIPTNLQRAIPVPGKKHQYVLLEDLIARHLSRLFPGVEIVSAHLFRVVRDADVEIRELEASDLITMIEQSLKLRRLGDPVLLEVQPQLGPEFVSCLMKGLQLDPQDVFYVDGQLGMDFLWEIAGADLPAHKFPVFSPSKTPELQKTEGIFEAMKQEAFLLHHPFDSFDPVEKFVQSISTDPQVIGIKQTLYRVGSKSPIVEALLEGGENGKQVAVLVELKARFDESNNLIWAKALERAGVHVTYGFPQMKTHCKLCLAVRKESDGIHSYAHIGTGNYNPATSRIYTDIGYFTTDPEICQDITELFNYLTGFSKQKEYRKLLVAPLGVREGIIDRIKREIKVCQETGKGRIIFKLNALVDPELIDALYEASNAGVEIDLLVRGICCLRPGVKGMSTNIRVTSIVGRFLEHSRIYWFSNGGDEEAYIGSADMMRRNLDRRIEVLVPVEQPKLIKYLKEAVLETCLKDTTNAWLLRPNGKYARRKPKAGETPFQAQAALMKLPAGRLIAAE